MFKYILIISLLIIPVYANAVTVSIPDKQGTADETLDIPVNIDNASKVAGADLTITFLSSILSATAVYTADLTSSFSVTANTNTAGEVRIALANSTGISSCSGALVNIRFKVNASASSGSTSPLTLQSVTLNDESGNSITPVTTQNGTFTVSSISDFTITASPSSRLLEQGSTTTYTVTVGSVSGFSDTVTLSVSGVPGNTTSSFSPSSLTPGNSTLTISAGNTATTGNVTLIITGTSSSKTHSYSVTLTILDSIAPSNASNFTITSGNTQCTLNWSNPTEADFSGLLVLRKNSAFNSDTDSPVSGTAYNAGDTIGSAAVVYKLTNETTKTDTGLINGSTYYYKIFSFDEVPNYSTGSIQNGTPISSLSASLTATPTSGNAPLTVSFSGGETGGIDPCTYSWNFGDGNTSTIQNPSHAYNSAGTYTVTLTVTDNASATDSESTTITVTSSDGGSGGGGGGCFIATAAYGSPMAEEVIILSRFRDERLLTNQIGKRLVSFYYRHGPYVADWIKDKEWVKKITRYILKPVVWIVK